MVFVLDTIAYEFFKVIVTNPAEILLTLIATVINVAVFGFIIGYILQRFTSIKNPRQNGFFITIIFFALLTFYAIFVGNISLSDGVVREICIIGILYVFGFWILLKRLLEKK